LNNGKDAAMTGVISPRKLGLRLDENPAKYAYNDFALALYYDC